jgi:predicted PurR-regulated permease PerM
VERNSELEKTKARRLFFLALLFCFLFFAILGGIHLFGIVGILYGPLILGVAAILLYLYELEYSEFLAEK